MLRADLHAWIASANRMTTRKKNWYVNPTPMQTFLDRARYARGEP